MGQQQSKDELVFQQVNYGNSEGIIALRNDGAGLEWIDKEGKTPLISACMNPELINVAKTLIELGANVNAYRPGRHAGTPLHHAAKRGLEQTVKLLLSHGANALMMNDDCLSPLGVAREKGYANVVRTIEGHICLFSGWLREFYGPGFLGLLAPQLLSRKVWVVILPCGSRNFTRPLKLELAIYVSPQDAQPRTTVALWKANLEEPKYNQADSSVVISDSSNKKSLLKLGPVDESDKEQLKRFCNACKGIPQVMHTFHPQAPVVPVTAPPIKEDTELAMAINASLQSAMQESRIISSQLGSGGNASTSYTPTDTNSSMALSAPASHKGSCSGKLVQEVISSGNPDSHIDTQSGVLSVVPATLEGLNPTPSPSAPPIADAEFDAGPIHYPSIDPSPVDLFSPAIETLPTAAVGKKQNDEASSSCVICLDSPVEGACIPLDSDNRKTEFNILSGTSMSCPHVSGAAALLKSAHPDWSAAAIRSAMMTTANTLNNMLHPMTDEATGKATTPYDFGAGHLNLDRAMDPGLVYDVVNSDYVSFLCAIGYGPKTIQVITRSPVNCPMKKPMAENLNYPSIAASFSSSSMGVASKTLMRTVMNVGEANAVYRVKVDAPKGTTVIVKPGKLVFTEKIRKLSYFVTVKVVRKNIVMGDSGALFGSLSWMDGKHVVRSPIVVTQIDPL